MTFVGIFGTKWEYWNVPAAVSNNNEVRNTNDFQNILWGNTNLELNPGPLVDEQALHLILYVWPYQCLLLDICIVKGHIFYIYINHTRATCQVTLCDCQQCSADESVSWQHWLTADSLLTSRSTVAWYNPDSFELNDSLHSSVRPLSENVVKPAW